MLAASGHITSRDRDLIRLVAEHRVLTTDQISAVAFGSVTTARHRLTVLAGLGLLRRFRPHRETGSAPWHYVLGPLGAALLGAEDRDEKKWAPQARQDRQLALARSQRLGHMTGTNWFFVQLTSHTRQHAGARLDRWDSEQAASAYLYGMSGRWHVALPHPDGLGVWAEDTRDLVFFLEYDTGSEHLPQLAAKLAGYAEQAPSTIGLRAPLLFCFLTPRREQSARTALAATRASAGLQIATAALNPSVTCPACGPAWTPLNGGYTAMRLIDLSLVFTDPWRAEAEAEEQQRH